MKKYIVIAFASLATLAGCQDFLVEEPILSQSNELTLSTYDGLNKSVAGAYAPLASSSWYGADFIIRNELKTSNGKKWIGSTYDSGRCNDLYNLNYEPNNTSALWGGAYYVISAVNNVLANLEGKETSDVTAQDLNNLKAECLFLLVLRLLDELGHDFGYKTRKPDKYDCVDEVEECMKHGETVKCGSPVSSIRIRNGKSFSCRVRESHEFNDLSNETQEWSEQDQCPDDSEYIEYRM